MDFSPGVALSGAKVFVRLLVSQSVLPYTFSSGQCRDQWRLMRAMQTLGISDSTPRSESRLKSLFWPSIESSFDVEYLALQGYWVCTLVAMLSFFLLLVAGQPILAGIVSLLFYLGGVGVREHNRFAAAIVFVYYVVDTLTSFRSLASSPGGGVIRVIIAALLLSNLRATWIAAGWKSGSEEAADTVRLNDTWTDKFANQYPAWIWPKVKVLYYIFSMGLLLVVGLGLIAMALHLPRAE